MVKISRDAQQDAALVTLLKALPEQRLDGILEALGVLAEDRAPARRDHRRCRLCGNGYVRCRRVAEVGDQHAWDPVGER